ncbi:MULTISPECIES: DUF86 domain-containing protein [Oligella]|uniref:DUF86 domain-containing protein n=1 Tax=Oligella urethralis DNF00040 TaxID=1401065 RepID=A0A096ABP8_9BURK|nr:MULTISPECIES: DUF86 domain-containing protein [Oligella]AVL70753.1 DUF86 domain-containing protein [Oligella urethralis]KGF28152.1 hypothetical protein HMPREF2130_09525 [Oligella urethralis DNF00040]OFS83375.1 hypothetical protein HMPREF3144_08990 [Oligella sp. HMSC05A10]OFV51081.1 hypothetical protein HMPREF3179_01625 [Oligella sp. HMSC09E12]PMC15674.1 DUF86 domain-containing protein [Oligella urethralis]
MRKQKDLNVYLEEILQAANYIDSYTKDLDLDEFIKDTKTSQAVILNLLIIGENANKLLSLHPEFTQNTEHLRWTAMRGMRNRIAHGYFEMNMEIVWETIQQSIPKIIEQIPMLIDIEKDIDR